MGVALGGERGKKSNSKRKPLVGHEKQTLKVAKNWTSAPWRRGKEAEKDMHGDELKPIVN